MNIGGYYKKNYVVVDFDPLTSGQVYSFRDLINSLNHATGKNFEFSGVKIKNHTFHSKERYIKYFYHAYKLFKSRKQIENMLSFQQFYGLIFAFYCRILHVRKTCNVCIYSFIYRPKKFAGGGIQKAN